MPGVVMKNNMNQQDDAKSITHFLSQIFRKVVRLVIGTVSLPALYDILKTIYVEEAQKKLDRDGGKPTKSAIALMTGLDTRVVSSLMDQHLQGTIEGQSVNPEHALIDMWTSDPFFLDPETDISQGRSSRDRNGFASGPLRYSQNNLRRRSPEKARPRRRQTHKKRNCPDDWPGYPGRLFPHGSTAPRHN